MYQFISIFTIIANGLTSLLFSSFELEDLSGIEDVEKVVILHVIQHFITEL